MNEPPVEPEYREPIVVDCPDCGTGTITELDSCSDCGLSWDALLDAEVFLEGLAAE